MVHVNNRLQVCAPDDVGSDMRSSVSLYAAASSTRSELFSNAPTDVGCLAPVPPYLDNIQHTPTSNFSLVDSIRGARIAASPTPIMTTEGSGLPRRGLRVIHVVLFRMATKSSAEAYRILGYKTHHGLDDVFGMPWPLLEKAAEATWPDASGARPRPPLRGPIGTSCGVPSMTSQLIWRRQSPTSSSKHTQMLR